MITVKNLYKSFGDVHVLTGIDEHISKGEVVVVIGPSGSGKSTFLRCLNLLEEPTAGEIYVDDELITSRKADVNKIRQKMGMVFQQFNLFPHLTIMDNITLAPVKLKKMTKQEAVAKGKELLERVGLSEKADAYLHSSPADRSSAWPSPVRLPCSPRSCFLTSPPARWTPKWSAKFWML